MTSARRSWMIVGLVAAVLALVGTVGVVAVSASRGLAGDRSVSRSAMMGGAGSSRSGPVMHGMMAGGTWADAGDGVAVTTLDAARTRAQAFADRLGAGLRVGEVMQFSNGYYAELLASDGSGATEVLVGPGTGAVSIEPGPAMMWNTRYGMHSRVAVAPRVDAEQALATAQAWLDARSTGLSVTDATAFPGYYTLDTTKDGRIVGMMSVNASTGATWYHTWHGSFVALLGD
jgi:hypothetical protein